MLRRMQAAVEAARGDGDEGPITEPIPKITAQIPSAATREGDSSPSASRGRVVEFKRPAKRHRGRSASPAKQPDQPKRKHGSGDPARSAPQTRQQAPAPSAEPPAGDARQRPAAQAASQTQAARQTAATPAASQTQDARQTPATPAASQAQDARQAPATPAASQTRDAQRAPAAPAEADVAPVWQPRPSGGSPVGTAPPPLPRRRPAESAPAAAGSDPGAPGTATPADPEDAPPRDLDAPTGIVPPARPEDVPAAAAEPPMRTVPTPAADPAALARAVSHIPKDLRDPRAARYRLQSVRTRRTAGIAAAMVIALAIGGVAIALAARSAPGNANASRRVSALHRQQLADTGAAVAWIDEQVSPGSVIACDPAMCDALKAQGYPADKLDVLGPTSAYPRSAAVVVETGSVRTLFGTSLSSDWAPAVLTRIGTGSAGIEIRVIAAGGVTAYQRALAGDLKARKQVGTLLLHGSQIATSARARAQVIAGAVDWRLLIAIAQIAGEYPVRIIDFGNDAVGATPGLPLRYADLSDQVRAGRMTGPEYMAAMAAALQQLPAEYRPLHTQRVPLPRGDVALRVEFAAPSPLNPLGPTGPLTRTTR